MNLRLARNETCSKNRVTSVIAPQESPTRAKDHDDEIRLRSRPRSRAPFHRAGLCPGQGEPGPRGGSRLSFATSPPAATPSRWPIQGRRRLLRDLAASLQQRGRLLTHWTIDVLAGLAMGAIRRLRPWSGGRTSREGSRKRPSLDSPSPCPLVSSEHVPCRKILPSS